MAEKNQREKKYAVITGSTKGIGKETGRLLLSEGFHVIFNYADDAGTASKLEKELSADYSGRFHIVHQKLETETDTEAFCAACLAVTESIDVLILNAGCTDRTPWERMTWKQWQRVMDVNLNAPSAVVRRLGSRMNRKGSIVFIGSVMGLHAHADSVPYSVSKAGVHSLAKALVKEYCEREIRVNAVMPGFVETSWQKDKSFERRAGICRKISLHRFAEPEEIAQTVLGVIQMSYINGALIEADGGYGYQ